MWASHIREALSEDCRSRQKNIGSPTRGTTGFSCVGVSRLDWRALLSPLPSILSILLILSKTSLCVSAREYSLLRLHQLLHQRWTNRYRHRLAVCVSLRLYLRLIRWQKSDGFMISNPRKPSRSSKSPSPLQITFALPPSAQAIMSSSSGSRQTASRSVAGRTIVSLLSRIENNPHTLALLVRLSRRTSDIALEMSDGVIPASFAC